MNLFQQSRKVVSLIAAGAIALAGVVAVSTPSTARADEPGTIVDVASGNADFSTLVSLVAAAELVETLQGDGPFTVLAPTNAAFAKVPEELLAQLAADKALLTQVLLYHVIAGKVESGTVVTLDEAETVQGEKISIEVVDGTVVLNGNSNVIAVDVQASNGVIHVIDTVLLPPSLTDPGTIVDIAAGNENFSTLVSLVSAAGLVETLSGEGPFTVFAPTNAAFEKVPAATLETLGGNVEALRAVLKYHVVAGDLMAADVVRRPTLRTVQGTPIRVRVAEDGTVYVNDAKVVATDIVGNNGVIHVIDGVILPPNLQSYLRPAAPAGRP